MLVLLKDNNCEGNEQLRMINKEVKIMADIQNGLVFTNDKCIGCNKCISVCPVITANKAIEVDGISRVEVDGDKCIACGACFDACEHDAREYKSVLGGLKKMGVNHIISVSFGADITTWGYVNYITKYDFKGGVSQPCPAIVGYIEHYLPELIPKLVPVQSPLMCAAIYVRKYMKITDKLAFISPCIAKKGRDNGRE